jgi:hypothetical protein
MKYLYKYRNRIPMESGKTTSKSRGSSNMSWSILAL